MIVLYYKQIYLSREKAVFYGSCMGVMDFGIRFRVYNMHIPHDTGTHTLNKVGTQYIYV